MKIIILTVFLLVSLSVSKQVYLSYVFRHGARYPLNNIYDGKQTAPFHGQLTAVGLRQQYLLGTYVQAEYTSKIPLFNATLKPREVEIFTVTDSERCIESAYGHALGLFSFGNGQKIDPSIDPQLLEAPFQTLPTNLKVQEAPSDSDFALTNGFQPVPIRNGQFFFPKCQNEVKIFERRAERIAPIIAEMQAEHALFTQEMRRLFNLTLEQSNLLGLTGLYDTLVADKYLGRPLPSKFTDQQFQRLYFIERYLFTLVYEGEVARIYNAPYVNSLISNMQNVIKGNLGVKKVSVVSAHDSNVLPLLVFYNLTSSSCLKRQWRDETVHENCAVPIPFASNLLFELHQNDSNPSNYFVKARYNGQYYNLCGRNSTECPFEQFAHRSKAYLLDFDKQCAKKHSESHKQEKSQLIDK